MYYVYIHYILYFYLFFWIPHSGVLRGSVVKCLTCKLGVLGSSRTGSSGFFRGSVLGHDTSEPQPSTGETQELSPWYDWNIVESGVKHHSIIEYHIHLRKTSFKEKV